MDDVDFGLFRLRSFASHRTRGASPSPLAEESEIDTSIEAEPEPALDPVPAANPESSPKKRAINFLRAPSIRLTGIPESHDGFFDALFRKPTAATRNELLKHAESTLPPSCRRRSDFSLKLIWYESVQWVKRVTSTYTGIKLLKSLAAYVIGYSLCLHPTSRDWLGPRHSLVVVSILVNHPSRPVGAQIDGTAMSTAGAALGLGWGVLTLWVCTCSEEAKAGYGALLALFFSIFIAALAHIRLRYARLYQFVLSAGVAVVCFCLVDGPADRIEAAKVRDVGLPWILGQAISLLVCMLFFPDGGSRSLAMALHDSFSSLMVREDLALIRHKLKETHLSLSEACRDLAIDISITRLQPGDVGELCQLLGAAALAILELELNKADETGDRGTTSTSTSFDELSSIYSHTTSAEGSFIEAQGIKTDTLPPTTSIRRNLETLDEALVSSSRIVLQACDAVLLDILGYRQALAPAATPQGFLVDLVSLRTIMAEFDTLEQKLLHNDYSHTSGEEPDLLSLLSSSRSVRQVAAAVEKVAAKVDQMEQVATSLPHIHLPSYPIAIFMDHRNAQVRHDCGGIVAGNFYRGFANIPSLFDEQEPHACTTQANDQRPGTKSLGSVVCPAILEAHMAVPEQSKHHRVRHALWRGLRQLKGHETKFAVKAALAMCLLSVPAFSAGQSAWWDADDMWWALIIGWFVMHARIAGNVSDLTMKLAAAVTATSWSGDAIWLGSGNAYVMMAFAILYMAPMLYIYILGRYSRAGLVGCITFTGMSLGLQTAERPMTPALVATRGSAFIVGIIGATLINWILWPFFARRELRKAASSTLFFLNVLYRDTVTNFVYVGHAEDIGSKKLRKSEMIEARLQEGFNMMRQLLVLTKHEIRLRAPFDPLPYSAVMDACERFFEHLVAARQSSVFHLPPKPVSLGGDEETDSEADDDDQDLVRGHPLLTAYWRDAVAGVLSTLYVLAGALRSGQRVPKYVPSARAAWERLLEKTKEILGDAEADGGRGTQRNCHHDEQTVPEAQAVAARRRRVHGYSCNGSLAGCIDQLEHLESYVKIIVGEQAEAFFDTEELDDEHDAAEDDGEKQ